MYITSLCNVRSYKPSVTLYLMRLYAILVAPRADLNITKPGLKSTQGRPLGLYSTTLQ